MIEDQEEKKIEAVRLIDLAEDALNNEKAKESIDLYEKAAQIYLDIGSYFKIDEIYIRIASIISQFKNHIQSVYRLKSIIRKTEKLKLDEISAKLLLQLGNISFKMKDYETAGEAWESASNYFYNLNPKEYHGLASELLLKAGQVLEKTHSNKNKGEQLILKSVMKMNRIEELLELEEKRGIQLLEMEKYEGAANKYLELANYFKKSIIELDKLINLSEEKEIMKNAKTRLMHITAEYETIAILSLRALKDNNKEKEINTLAKEIIDLLKETVYIIKEIFNSKRIEIDNEDIMRITFDVFLISLIQNLILETEEIRPIDYLLQDLEKSSNIKKIKNTAFYSLIERIDKVGFKESLKTIEETNLGRIDKIKKILII
ncbi:MAG: hypothetical protein JXA99_12410 [Candidatus Lokiarchaeota archaeon]|nr:hypothetical protein [Candidatus Lokiarchaeota archaeon]